MWFLVYLILKNGCFPTGGAVERPDRFNLGGLPDVTIAAAHPHCGARTPAHNCGYGGERRAGFEHPPASRMPQIVKLTGQPGRWRLYLPDINAPARPESEHGLA